MKKTLLIGIAALFLATEAAHAYPPEYFDCGKAFVTIETAHGSGKNGRVFPRTWTIQENWEREDAKRLNVIESVNLKCDNTVLAASEMLAQRKTVPQNKREPTPRLDAKR
jgi:hypothetical protein